jgi:hypothetical protein
MQGCVAWHVCVRVVLLQALADKVMKGIAKQEGSSDFNGVHLRMEPDAADWSMILGGEEQYRETYLQAMADARFSEDTPLYVASGLLTGSSDIYEKSTNTVDTESMAQMNNLTQGIMDAGVCSALCFFVCNMAC